MDALVVPREWWRNTEGIARPLVVLLAVQAAATAALAFLNDGTQFERWHGVVQAWLDGNQTLANDRMQRVSDGISSAQQTLTQLLGYVGIATLVLLVIWAWRSVKNARALGRVGARLSPGWTIAAFLIPVASNVLLYFVFTDLLRSAAADVGPGSEWRARRTPAIVPAWLAAKVGGFVCTMVAIGSIVNGTNASSMRPLLVVGALLSALGVALFIPMVLQVTRGQMQQYGGTALPTRADVMGAGGGYSSGAVPVAPIVRGPDGLPVPGWYPDPSGGFEFRYWDGGAWTEHVSRGGVAALSPVDAPAVVEPTVPAIEADWYPDPSGRHQWRFWGGDDWTPHVSDDDVHSDDPLVGSAPPPVPHPPV